MKKLFIIFGSLIAISCGSTKLLAPTQTDADRAAAKFPNVTLAQLNEGKVVFEAQCDKCHGLGKPVTKTDAELERIVPKMVVKSNKKAGSEVIDAAKQESILRYLVTMNKN